MVGPIGAVIANRGHGIGSAAIAAFTAVVFGLYPHVDVIVSVSQKDNRASCRALEKAGFALLSERELNTGDPSDAGITLSTVLSARGDPYARRQVGRLRAVCRGHRPGEADRYQARHEQST